MGAWNYGVFDDDTVYDALDDLKASPKIAADMEKYFDAVRVKRIMGRKHRISNMYINQIPYL